MIFNRRVFEIWKFLSKSSKQVSTKLFKSRFYLKWMKWDHYNRYIDVQIYTYLYTNWLCELNTTSSYQDLKREMDSLTTKAARFSFHFPVLRRQTEKWGPLIRLNRHLIRIKSAIYCSVITLENRMFPLVFKGKVWRFNYYPSLPHICVIERR